MYIRKVVLVKKKVPVTIMIMTMFNRNRYPQNSILGSQHG